MTSILARIFAGQNPENNVAIMDIDLCGPSIPLMMGVEGIKQLSHVFTDKQV